MNPNLKLIHEADRFYVPLSQTVIDQLVSLDFTERPNPNNHLNPDLVRIRPGSYMLIEKSDLLTPWYELIFTEAELDSALAEF